MHQLNIVDRIPNGALLYGFHPDADLRPDALKAIMNTVYDYKILALDAMIAANARDVELLGVYRAKIEKERGGKSVCHDAAFQRATRERVAQLLKDLNHTLGRASFPYLKGTPFSLGDVLRGVNLVRLTYLGLASMWVGLPNVARYFDALVKRPSLYREAVQATIGSLPHSSHMDEIAGDRDALSA